ncbi:MAG: twin-arginine translocase TatA/TatE family subunit [Magnetococcus sp. DMHC-1]
MLGFDWSEVLVIMVVALIVIGPDKLPEVARGLSKAMRQIRRLTNEIRNSINLEEITHQGREYIGAEGMPPFTPASTYTPPPSVDFDREFSTSEPPPKDIVAESAKTSPVSEPAPKSVAESAKTSPVSEPAPKSGAESTKEGGETRPSPQP